MYTANVIASMIKAYHGDSTRDMYAANVIAMYIH